MHVSIFKGHLGQKEDTTIQPRGNEAVGSPVSARLPVVTQRGTAGDEYRLLFSLWCLQGPPPVQILANNNLISNKAVRVSENVKGLACRTNGFSASWVFLFQDRFSGSQADR